MTAKNLYRTLLLTSLAISPVLLSGCGGGQMQNKMKEASQVRWDSTRIAVMLQLAQQQYTVGDYVKCRETLAQAFAAKTPSAPLHILAARVELENGSLEEANNHLKAATRIDGNNPEVYYLLGVVYQRWQNIQSAHDYYELAFQKKPGDALYLLAVVEMKIALGQHDEAQKLLEDKIVYFEQSSAIRVALGKLATLKGDYDKASRYLLEATLLAPENVGVRENYAEALFYGGRYKDAEQVLVDLHANAAITEKTNLTMLLGQCYMNMRRPRDARNCFAEITRDNPNNANAWINLGKTCIQLDDPTQAGQVARRVLNTDPKNLSAMVLLALSQQKQTQWNLAEKTLATAALLAPKDSTVLCMKGINAQHLGDNDKAVQIFTQAVEINPNDTWAQELLASARPVPPTTPVQAHLPETNLPVPETTAIPVTPVTPAIDTPTPADAPATPASTPITPTDAPIQELPEAQNTVG